MDSMKSIIDTVATLITERPSQADIAWRVAIEAGNAQARRAQQMRPRRAVPVGALVERVGTYQMRDRNLHLAERARDGATYRGERRNKVIREEGRAWRGIPPTHRTVWPEFTERERQYMAVGLNGPRAMLRRRGSGIVARKAEGGC